MSINVVGVKLDGTPELFFRAVPIPVTPKHCHSKRGVAVGKTLVYLDRSVRRSLRLCERIRGRYFGADPERSIRVGDPGICKRVIGIEIYRLLEIGDPLPNVAGE